MTGWTRHDTIMTIIVTAAVACLGIGVTLFWGFGRIVEGIAVTAIGLVIIGVGFVVAVQHERKT
jgi:hypothetical protein